MFVQLDFTFLLHQQPFLQTQNLIVLECLHVSQCTLICDEDVLGFEISMVDIFIEEIVTTFC